MFLHDNICYSAINCPGGTFALKGKCEQNCDELTAINIETNICEECDINCKKCYAPSNSKKCISCQINFPYLHILDENF